MNGIISLPDVTSYDKGQLNVIDQLCSGHIKPELLWFIQAIGALYRRAISIKTLMDVFRKQMNLLNENILFRKLSQQTSDVLVDCYSRYEMPCSLYLIIGIF